MNSMRRGSAPLVLLIDEDPITRNLLQPALRPHGLEVVQARSSVAALELLQRVARRFRLVVVSLEMPGLSGVVLLETLRIFQPAMAAICLTAAEGLSTNGAGGCLTKPPRQEDLRARIADALAGAATPASGVVLAPEAVARARSAFAHSASLLDAAREIAKGLQGESAIGS